MELNGKWKGTSNERRQSLQQMQIQIQGVASNSMDSHNLFNRYR